MTYLEASLVEPVKPRKTLIWNIKGKLSGVTLGCVAWFAQWRKYCFYADPNSIVLDELCLRDIADFCAEKTKEHYRSIQSKQKEK